MANVFRTTTSDFLRPYAGVAIKETAETIIKETMARFEETLRQRVYDEVAKISVRFVEAMNNANDPLSHREMHIVIDDRREGTKR